MKINKKHKLFFAIPLLGIILFFSFGLLNSNYTYNNQSKEKFEITNTFQHFSNSNSNLIFTEESEQDVSLYFDESELELEFNWFEDFSKSLNNFYFTSYKKITTSGCFFVTLKNKIPLYKLFCKWKLHLN